MRRRRRSSISGGERKSADEADTALANARVRRTRRGTEVLEVDTIASTNAAAMAAAPKQCACPFWVSAKSQTAGRGRSGRGWQSPEGNLAASMAFTTTAPADQLGQVALVAGVAIAEAVREILPAEVPETGKAAPDVRLKWPNDLLINGAKIAGILVEASRAGREAVVVAGFGLNLRAAPAIQDRAVAALSDFGAVPPREQVLDILDDAFADALCLWNNGTGFADVRARWLQAALPMNTSIRVNDGHSPISGAFAGLGPSGELLLSDPKGQIRRFSFGDVDVVPRHEDEDT
ncbi:MAG: biotin--[acetyl-CoA-carboxylase] ligase [Pseudomonadota bacterium]